MLERFRTWWRAPITRRDRVNGFGVGLFAGFWIGFLGRIMVGASTASLGTILAWGLAGAIVVGLVGSVFPKLVTVALFPFAVIGTGP